MVLKHECALESFHGLAELLILGLLFQGILVPGEAGPNQHVENNAKVISCLTLRINFRVIGKMTNHEELLRYFKVAFFFFF